MRFSIKNVSSVREFLITKIFTYVQISSSQGVYKYFWINGCPSMQQSGLSLLLLCMPLYDLLPFLIHCCLCIKNQHCLGWKIFYSYFSVSRGKRFWETDLQNCLNIRNSRFPNIHISFVYTPRISSVYTRDSPSRPTSGVHTSFFPSSHLRVSRTHQVVGLLEEFWLTDTPSLDETSCASFHLKNKKIKCRDVFRSFHWNEFAYQVVILHRILSFSCTTNKNDFFFRHFGSC